MFCGVFPPHGVNNFISSSMKRKPSKLLYFFLHLSCQKQLFVLAQHQAQLSFMWHQWLWFFWVHRRGDMKSHPQWAGLLCWWAILFQTLLKSSLAIISMESFSPWSSVSSHGSHQHEAGQKQNISLSVRARKRMTCSGNVTWRLQICPIYLGR